MLRKYSPVAKLLFFKSGESMKDKMLRIGIVLNEENGHIKYDDSFVPFNLDLVLVRHGETPGNCGQSTPDGQLDSELVKSNIKDKKKRIYQGNVDEEINKLSDTGIQQAKEVALKLKRDFLDKGWKPDLVITSPLSRAIETGRPFAEQNGFEMIVHPGIREMSFGWCENVRVCDIDKDHPSHQFYLDQHALIKNDKNPKGEYVEAENFCEVILRVYDVLFDISETHPGAKILAFSHSMVGAACCILTGNGQLIENGDYIAFDGEKENGEPYTLRNATPVHLVVPERYQKLFLKNV